MPLDDIPQLDEVDDVLDALTSPTSLEVYEAILPYENDMVAAAIGKKALVGGVGGPPSGAAGGVLGGTYPNPGFAVDMATGAELNAHVDAVAAAHAATAVAFTPAGTIAATTVQAAIEEVASEAGVGGMASTLFDANTILKADSDDTPVALTMGASTVLARLAAGNIVAATTTEMRTLLDVPTNGEAVLDALYDANTVLAADSDNTPAAVTMGASTILARLAAGNIKAASVAEIIALLAAYTAGGTDVAVADGGTGASTAATALTNLGAAAALVTENIQTDNYTLVLGDASLRIVMNKGTAVNLTVPTNASVAFPVGTTIEVFQLGAGQVTFVMTSLTSQSPAGKLKLTGQYSSAALCKRATDTWSIAGDLAA